MKIGILHHRVGLKDGVSLEIAKRKKVLEEMGHKVILVSGPKQKGADYVLAGLKIPEVSDLKKIGLKRELEKIQTKEKIEVWMVHNILSLGRHPKAGEEVLVFLDEWQGRVVAVHHDIYWERSEMIARARGEVRKIWRECMVPKRDYMKQVVINSLAAREVWQRRRVRVEIMGDVFDFERKYGSGLAREELRRELGIEEDEVVVLQATRIVPRKGIELGIRWVAEWQRLSGRKVKLLFTNEVDLAEPEAMEYWRKLKKLAKKLRVKLVVAKRGFDFWDGYRVAEVINYSSLIEGWGNQFLEAVYFKKPIVVFEYPVFRADILPEGYRVISLGDRFEEGENGLVEVSEDRLRWVGKRVEKVLERWGDGDWNYQIARKNHSLEVLRNHLKRVLS